MGAGFEVTENFRRRGASQIWIGSTNDPDPDRSGMSISNLPPYPLFPASHPAVAHTPSLTWVLPAVRWISRSAAIPTDLVYQLLVYLHISHSLRRYQPRPGGDASLSSYMGIPSHFFSPTTDRDPNRLGMLISDLPPSPVPCVATRRRHIPLPPRGRRQPHFGLVGRSRSQSIRPVDFHLISRSPILHATTSHDEAVTRPSPPTWVSLATSSVDG